MGWSAYVPALPGLGIPGSTRAETEQFVAEAIVFHLEGLQADGLPLPTPDAVDVGQVEARLP